jgi:hypothetical protein
LTTHETRQQAHHDDRQPAAATLQPIATLTLDRRLAATWTVTGIALFAVALVGFAGLYATVVGEDGLAGDGLTLLLALLLGGLLVVVPHEACHGLAIRALGGRPRYGVGLAHGFLPYAYATSDATFSRRGFVAVALAPLLVLSLLGGAAMVLFEWPWLAVPLALNAGGAVGDLWMTLVVLGTPAGVRVRDETTGLTLLGTPDAAVGRSPLLAAFAAFGVGTAVAVGLLVVGGAFAPVVALALGWDGLTVTVPGLGWPVLGVDLLDDGFTVRPHAPGVVALAALVGLAGAVGRGVVAAVRPPD